jgi:hypothetical protein
MQHSTGADRVEDTGRVAAKGLVSKALKRYVPLIFHCHRSAKSTLVNCYTAKSMSPPIAMASQRSQALAKPKIF